MRLLTRAEQRSATAAPRPCDGFVGRRVTVDGIVTHVRAAVGAAGAPVVLLHGLAVSHRYLMPTARALAAHHPVAVPDLPGFGLSGTPPQVYGPDAHARHVAALLDGGSLAGIAGRPVCLVGHSFGAEVAARLAATRPESVSALVLAGPTSDPAARSYRGQVGRWLADLVREDPRQAAILARDVRDAGPRRILRTLRTSVHNRIEADLGAVTAPVLLLRGGADPVAPREWLRRAAVLCGGPAEIAELDGAGHNALTTAGADAARLISDFLARAAAHRSGSPTTRRSPGPRPPG
jgi:pimeloyl-ACP methyl ester carboxylesterase